MGSFKFQTRLTIVYLALFFAVQGIIILAFYTSVNSNVDEQVQNQLRSSAKTFSAIVQRRIDLLAGRARDQARQFEFRDTISTGDVPTIRSAMRNFSKRIEADLALVYDLDGNIITSVGSSGFTNEMAPALSPELFEQTEAENIATSIVEIDGHIYEVVFAPVLAPDLMAVIAYGIELDQDEALSIKLLSSIDLEIAFLYKDDGTYRVASATSGERTLSRFLEQDLNQVDAAVFKSRYQGDDYMFWRLELSEAALGKGEIAALLYYSVDTALAPYVALAVTLSVVLLVGIIMLIGGSVVLSRGVTRPLRVLARATYSIAEGDYHEVEALKNGDEIAKLTDSFNRMVGAVKEREQKIVFQAFHDAETGLPNRNQFEKNLALRIENKKEFCLVIAEVQQLTELRSVLNNTHLNDLLSGIGERISQVANVEVARLSTESFAFITDDVGAADIIASLIINAFMTPFEIADVVVDASIKMGLTKFPDDKKDGMKLLQTASSALETGRKAAKGFAWYVADDGSSYKQRLSLMSDLRDALTSGEVFFAYQPKLELQTGAIKSAEALVRWVSPSRGFVPPDEFIPFAEKTGDVRHVTDWGLRTAIAQAADWRSRNIYITVAVNLSTSDLMNANLPGQVLKLLRDYNLPASCLKLEVTESAVMHDMTRALDVLNMLSAMGIVLSIDDYGTGYSSLSYLKKLPVSELKIDMSFVRKLAESSEDRILVRSTIELGHNLGLEITAEGVEDQKSIDLLTEYGCDTVQGYFISKPVPANEFEAFLEAKNAKK